MKKSALTLLGGVLALIAFAAVSKAQSIAIQNGDFTDPTLAPGAYDTYGYQTAQGVPDWTWDPSYGGVGVQNFSGTGAYLAFPTASTNAVFDDGVFGYPSYTPASLYQDLTLDGTHTSALDFVQAGTYTLNVYGGWRTDKSWPGGSISLETTSGDLLGTDSTVALVQPTQGYFALTTLTFDVTASNPYIGDQLRVVLTSDGNSTGFDDVTLNFAAVPEPSTWAMMIAGLAFLGFRLHRRSLFRP